MTEEMGMHRRRLADQTILRGAQRQNLYLSSLRGLLDNEPRVAALKCPARAVDPAFAGEEERLVVGEAVLLGPQKQLTCEPELGTRQEHSLDSLVGVLPI